MRSCRGSGIPLYFFSLIIPVLFLFPLLSSAEDNPSASMTLDDAYRLAIANHETVRIAGEGVVQAESNLDKAISKMLPNLTAEGAYTVYTEKKMSGTLAVQPDNATRVDLKLTQPIYSGGKEWTARRQARLLLQKSKEGLGYSRETIIRNTANAYYNVLKAEKDLEIKKAALNRAGERSKVAAARFKVGEVTRSAVLRADAETAGAEAEVIKAESNLIDAKNLFKRTVGIEGDVSLAEPAPQSPLSDDISGLVSKAVESRKDYKQSVLEEKNASEGIKYARGGFAPSLKLEGLYSHKDQNPQTTFFIENSTSASIILTYPIFEGGLRKAELTEAKSKFREAEQRRIGLKKDIEIEVRDAFNNVEYLRSVIESYKKQVSFAEEDYKMVFEQFKFGLATTVDVIDADTTLISAQRSLMNATYDYQLSILELKYRVGVLLDETVKTAANK